MPLGILLPRGHALAGASSLDLGDLSGTPYIALDETTVIRRMVDAALAGDAPIAPAHECSTGSAAYRLVATGLGFTFADRVAVDPELWERVALVPWSRRIELPIGTLRPGEAGATFERVLAEVLRERLRLG